MTEAEQVREGSAPDSRSGAFPEGIVERLFKFLSAAALIAMLVLIGADIFTRSALNFSFEISDEIGGYMLVALAFLSLSVCHINGSFHQVEFLQGHLTERGRILSRVFFELLMLFVSALLLWQYVRLELASWRFGEKAPTYLETPLWAPRLLLVAGMAALCWSLCRTIAADLRRIWHPDRAGGRRADGL